MKLYKNIPRQVIILGAVSFFTDFASEMLYPVTPIFLTAALGASMATVGMIEGLAEITAGILKGYFGALSDKLKKRSIFVLLGYGLSGIVKPLPGLFPYLGTVLFSRISDRIGKGIRTSPRDALLAAYSENNTGAVFGFHRSMDTFGAVAGPLTALILLFFFPQNYILVFLAAIIPSFFAILFTLSVKDPELIEKRSGKYRYLDFFRDSSREYKELLLILTFFSLFNSSDVFLILKSMDISKSDTTAILGYVFFNFVYAILSYPVGILADKVGKRRIFIIGLFVFSAVYMGFALNDNVLVVWILFAFYGFYSAASEGIAKAWVSDLSDERFRGSAIGLLNMLTSFSIMLGSVIAGILWDVYGSALPFFISSIASFITALLLIFFRRRINK